MTKAVDRMKAAWSTLMNAAQRWQLDDPRIWWCRSPFIAVLAIVSACTTSPAPLPRPVTVEGLLTNLQTGLDDGRFFDDAFYTQANLLQFFGGTEVKRDYFSHGEPQPFTRFWISGFSAIVPPVTLPGGRVTLQGLTAQVTKSTKDVAEHGEIISVSGSLTFESGAWNVEANHVMSVLHYPWTEDSDAEATTFMAIAREPFNPPARPQHIVHYVWTAGGYKKNIELNFGSGPCLWMLTFSAIRQ